MDLKPCVPVFDAGSPCPENESRAPVFGHRERVADAINVLIEFGFILGCDGELLPPRWLRRPVRKGGRVG